MRSRMDLKLGFTLIELLIVVAIIGILAAIAVPNFLEAQTRAKVSRAMSDIRTMVLAVELYNVDENGYISGSGYTDLVNLNSWPSPDFLKVLTTPVSYMSDLPAVNPFGSHEGYGMNENSYGYSGGTYWHDAMIAASWVPLFYPEEYLKAGYMWLCVGPSRHYSGHYNWMHSSPSPWVVPYNATNGTISIGDIIYVHGPGQTAQWHSFR